MIKYSPYKLIVKFNQTVYSLHQTYKGDESMVLSHTLVAESPTKESVNNLLNND